VFTGSSLFDSSQTTIGIYVTCTRTVSQLADRVTDVRVLMFFVGTRFVIVGMAPGAIRLETCGLPNHRLAVALVTAGTCHAKSMVSRIGGRGVPEIYRRPVRGVVAFITLHVGYKMIGCFSGCSGSIVTAGTTPRHQSVIKICRTPRQSAVTAIALS